MVGLIEQESVKMEIKLVNAYDKWKLCQGSSHKLKVWMFWKWTDLMNTAMKIGGIVYWFIDKSKTEQANLLEAVFSTCMFQTHAILTWERQIPTVRSVLGSVLALSTLRWLFPTNVPLWSNGYCKQSFTFRKQYLWSHKHESTNTQSFFDYVIYPITTAQ